MLDILHMGRWLSSGYPVSREVEAQGPAPYLSPFSAWPFSRIRSRLDAGILSSTVGILDRHVLWLELEKQDRPLFLRYKPGCVSLRLSLSFKLEL